MAVISINKDDESTDKISIYSDNIIQFPAKSMPSEARPLEIVDPDICIYTQDGRKLDKLGLAADECCYILPPNVQVICLKREERDSVTSEDGVVLPETIPVRVILSESDAVTEIGMVNVGNSASTSEPAEVMHWIDPGHTLFLARQSPDHVAMISLRLTVSERSAEIDPVENVQEQDDQREI